jgi:hypothetical protein
MKMDTQDGEEVTIEGAKTVNAIVTEECGGDVDHVTMKKEDECPEVLSALTLVARSSVGQRSLAPARASGDESTAMAEVTKSEAFLLAGESGDVCAKLGASGSDFQTVDDIVNERLDNLTAGSNLVDFPQAMNAMSKPPVVTSQHLIDRLGQFRSLPLPSDMTVNTVSSFDPEIALAAMGEGETHSANTPSQHFPSTLQQMETVPNDSGSSFDPEVALAGMGEGEQVAEGGPTGNQFPSALPQISVNISGNAGTPFDPEVALAVLSERGGSSANGMRARFSSVGGASGKSYRPGMDLGDMGDDGSDTKTVSRCTEDVIRVSRFDPSMSLVTMEQGRTITTRESAQIPYEPPLPQTSASGESGSSFDPEIALAAMSEGGSIQTCASSRGQHARVPVVNAGSFQLQCGPDLGLADVSLDESGPELDFEALSEEFSKNTRQR